MLLPHNPTEDRLAAFVDIVLGVGLLTWGVVRIRRPDSGPPKPSTPRGLGLISLAGTGMIFAFAAIADPTFVSLVVIAGRAEHYWSVVAAHSTWTLVSHIPLVLVLAFALIGENERIVTWVRTLWARISPWMVRLVTGVVLLVGTFLLLDALWWFATGEFFIPV
jgi:cytochrome c biogenesis protein CcdA